MRTETYLKWLEKRWRSFRARTHYPGIASTICQHQFLRVWTRFGAYF